MILLLIINYDNFDIVSCICLAVLVFVVTEVAKVIFYLTLDPSLSVVEEVMVPKYITVHVEGGEDVDMRERMVGVEVTGVGKANGRGLGFWGRRLNDGGSFCRKRTALVC